MTSPSRKAPRCGVRRFGQRRLLTARTADRVDAVGDQHDRADDLERRVGGLRHDHQRRDAEHRSDRPDGQTGRVAEHRPDRLGAAAARGGLDHDRRRRAGEDGEEGREGEECQRRLEHSVMVSRERQLRLGKGRLSGRRGWSAYWGADQPPATPRGAVGASTAIDGQQPHATLGLHTRIACTDRPTANHAANLTTPSPSAVDVRRHRGSAPPPPPPPEHQPLRQPGHQRLEPDGELGGGRPSGRIAR